MFDFSVNLWFYQADIRFVSPCLCSVSLGSVSACECSGLSLSVRAVVYDTCRSDEKYKG